MIAPSIAALIAVLIIVWLGHHYHSRKQTDLRLAGDNLYYLGLLFTLTSLIVALLQLFVFQPENDDLRQRTHDLIGNFGIALVSTVAGILGRIILQTISDDQSSDQPSSPASETDLLSAGGDTVAISHPSPGTADNLPTIAESMMELRRTLRDASDAFSHFTRLTQNQAEQAKAHSESLIREFNSKMSAEAERGLSDVTTAWQEAAKAVSVASNDMAVRIDRKVAAATARTEGEWRDLSEEVAAVSKSARIQLASDVSDLSALLDRIAFISKALDSLATGLDIAGSGTRSLGLAASEAAGRLNDRADEMVDAYKSLVRGTSQVQEVGLAGFGDSVVKFTKVARDQLERDSKEWMSSVTEIRRAAELHVGKVTRDAEAVRQLAEGISAQLDRFLPRIEQMTDSIEKAVRATDALRGPIALESGKTWWIDGKWY